MAGPQSKSLIRLGIISDTHGVFDRRIPLLFKGLAHIFHAGDVGIPKVLARLEMLAPVTAVVGNTDTDELACLPPSARAEFGGKKILVTHFIGRPTKLNAFTSAEIQLQKPDILVYGHSHMPALDRVGGIFMFNPGSAGPKRFDLPRSVGILEICEGRITADWLSLE